MKTAIAQTGSPSAAEPDARTDRGRHRRRSTRRSVVSGAVMLSIAVGTGFATADSLGDPAARISAPAAALGPPGPAARPGPHGLDPGTGTGTGARSEQVKGKGKGQDAKGAGAARKPARKLPGLGPGTLARIPGEARQVVIAAGSGTDAFTTSVTLWTRGKDDLWRAGETWQAHNGLRGWSREHRVGDLRSPVGVFSLSDAGGLERDPGTRLPYHRSKAFSISGTGFRGEPLEGTFDHVVAIDYNRAPGTSPLDGTKPLGPQRGGGIWLHVDHGGPTQGCVTLAEDDLVTLMRTLDPADKPVIVMGDRRSLER